MTDSVIDKLILAYGLDVKLRLPMQSGYRNKNFPILLSSGKIVNLVVYKREPDMVSTIQNANRLGGYLHTNKFPARYSYDKRIIRVYAAPHEQFAAVYAYLPGKTIPWEAYTMAHIKSLGKTMSDMHSLLADITQNTLATIPAVYTPIINRMHKYFSDPLVANAMHTKLGLKIDDIVFTNNKKLIKIATKLPEQPLHMDFVRSNVLFANNSHEITGVLDFEKAVYGSPVFDIARTLAFLLVDCKYKTEAQVRKYFLQSGYNKYGRANFSPITVRISNRTLDVLEEAINMFLFYDFYKFLRHNPYESLHANEHYIRTVNLLVSRGVIRLP